MIPQYSWGSLEAPLKETLKQSLKNQILPRLLKKDTSLWTKDASVASTIAERLGWLDSPFKSHKEIDAWTSLREEIKKEFSHIVLMGMGGSSLAPEVFKDILAPPSGFPRLHVMDSTDPESIKDVEKKVELSKTLFIHASKSGTTIEPASIFNYFYDKVKTGSQFAAITDPGTFLEKISKDKKFKYLILSQADVGGRFAALTAFGLVPAALMGIDIQSILKKTIKFTQVCSENYSDSLGHPVLPLGAAMAAAAQKGRNKLTLITSKGLEPFGDWVEQLVAESTGKHGKGVLPVVRESIDDMDSPHRLFVVLHEGLNAPLQEKIKTLTDMGHPVIQYLIKRDDLGSEFFRWEMATAITGSLLSLDPFDQPDVQSAKDKTNALLKNMEEGGELKVPSSAKHGEWKDFWKGLEDHEPIHVLAFLPPQKKGELEHLRQKIQKLTKKIVTLGLGPRYLHSTGQWHKGGPCEGAFLILIATRHSQTPIPGRGYGFEALQLAQAYGDFEALVSRSRRAFLYEMKGFQRRDFENLEALLEKDLSKLYPSHTI